MGGPPPNPPAVFLLLLMTVILRTTLAQINYKKFSSFKDSRFILAKWSAEHAVPELNFSNFIKDSVWTDSVPSASSCLVEHFRCHDGSCVPEWCCCDSIPQCPDGSDELGCTKPDQSETNVHLSVAAASGIPLSDLPAASMHGAPLALCG